MNGHWKYPLDINVEEWFGFVYRIIDTTNGKHYIGKKQLWSVRRTPVKGKKNKKKVTKESDWKTYTSSSTHINDRIKEHGIDKFVFIIETLHSTKASLHYAELERQVLEDVLRAKDENGEPKYYNKMIGNVKFIPPSETEVERLHRIPEYTVTQSVNNQHVYGDVSAWKRDIY